MFCAVRKGDLIVPNKCKRCNKKKKLEAHHEDYSKPLEVTWLCRQCHNEIHNEIKGGDVLSASLY